MSPRSYDSTIITALEAGAMQIAHLLKVVDALGATLAFTDHTEDITISAVVYLARPGMQISRTVSSADMSVDNTRVQGYFKTGTVTMADVLNGRFEGATYQLGICKVGGTVRGIADFGSIGEVVVIDDAFDIELRSEMSKLSRPVNRVTSVVCDAALGDARCAYSHSSPNHLATSAIVGVTDAITFTATISAATHPLAVTSWFNGGVLTWTGGGNSGYKSIVGNYSRTGDTGTFVLLLPPGQTITAADAFSVKSGCDHLLATCISKFSNANNFRGFPDIEGEDAFYPADKNL